MLTTISIVTDSPFYRTVTLCLFSPARDAMAVRVAQDVADVGPPGQCVRIDEPGRVRFFFSTTAEDHDP